MALTINITDRTDKGSTRMVEVTTVRDSELHTKGVPEIQLIFRSGGGRQFVCVSRAELVHAINFLATVFPE